MKPKTAILLTFFLIVVASLGTCAYYVVPWFVAATEAALEIDK